MDEHLRVTISNEMLANASAFLGN